MIWNSAPGNLVLKCARLLSSDALHLFKLKHLFIIVLFRATAIFCFLAKMRNRLGFVVVDISPCDQDDLSETKTG